MAQTATADTRRRVYVHCRPIFSGATAQVRKKKKIKDLVCGSWASLQPLLNDIDKSRVIDILQSLLEARIFESEARAKTEFPDVFSSSSIRDVQREASETSAAKSSEEILDSITARHDQGLDTDAVPDSEPDEHRESSDSVNGQDKLEIPPPPPNEASDTTPPKQDIPSLYPSYLPYQTQHVILTTIQQVLEECCFSFAAAAMPSLLKEKQWECPAAAELTQWVKLFRKGKAKSTAQGVPTELCSHEAQQMLTTVSHLRHTAVHRLPTTARGITQLLDGAVKLAQTLQDDLRAGQLDKMRRDIDLQIKAMELNKNVLEDTVSAGLQAIQRQRQELERMEADLIQKMLVDDENNRILVGRLLENSARRIFSGETEDVAKEEEEEKSEELEESTRVVNGDGRVAEQRQEEEEEGEEEEDDDMSGYQTSCEERLGDGDEHM